MMRSVFVMRLAAYALAGSLLGIGAVGIGVPVANAAPITCRPTGSPVEIKASGVSINNDVVLDRSGSGEYTPDCAALSIPNRLLTSGGGVRVTAFPIKTRTGYREDRGPPWSIDKDTAGHGGRAWKLKNSKGVRVASLYSNGMIAKID